MEGRRNIYTIIGNIAGKHRNLRFIQANTADVIVANATGLHDYALDLRCFAKIAYKICAWRSEFLEPVAFRALQKL